jgi:hypothetical protein
LSNAQRQASLLVKRCESNQDFAMNKAEVCEQIKKIGTIPAIRVSSAEEVILLPMR